MRSVSLVLGMEVTRDRENGTLSICQEYFIKSVLQRFGMGGCIPVSTPGFGAELSTEQPEETLLNEEETQRYQAITGSVMYLTEITRYDIIQCIPANSCSVQALETTSSFVYVLPSICLCCCDSVHFFVYVSLLGIFNRSILGYASLCCIEL